MSKFLDKTGLDTFWAKIKSTFQTLGLVTAWGSTPSDTKYPSEKLVKDSLDAKVSSIKKNGSTITPASGVADIGYIPVTETQSTATVQNLIQALRVKPGGRLGSVIVSASTIGSVAIASAWYNYLWIPHRTGNSNDDNQNFGTLVLTPLTSAPDVYVIEGQNLAGSSPTYRAIRLGNDASFLYANLAWGGAFRTSLSPFDNYAFKSANCFFGAKPSAIRVEYSTDGGTTWLDYGLTDAQKQNLLSQYGTISVYCGHNTHIQPGYTGSISGTKDLSDANIANQRLRITICDSSLANEGTTGSTDRWLYCPLRRIGIYMSTNSASAGTHCLFERRTSANFKSGTDTWVSEGDYKILGDTGWNSIPCHNATAQDGITFGQNDSQTREIRFTIWSDKLNASPAASQTGNLCIYKVVAYSENLWTNNSSNPNVANFGSPYAINSETGLTYFQKGITSGVAIPVGSGGTGKTSAKAAEYNLTTGKSEISDTTSGDDRVVFELASPSESNGVTRGFRKLSTIWTWIKGLLSSESGVNISGNAATATALASGSADRTKLDGIAAGAEVNVQSDWNQATTTADDYIKNKPTLGTAAAKNVPTSGNASTSQVVMGNDTRLSDARTPTAHTHTADAADVVDSSGDSAITDSTDIITTHVNGYSSTNKKLYRRNFKDYVWPWIKDKISSVLGLTATSYGGNAATATAFSSGTAKTKFDGIAEGATKTEASTTNGKVKINGTDTTVYTHPTQTAYTSKGSATKVPQITTDGTGHVTGITEVTISGVTPASHTHGEIDNDGCLTTGGHALFNQDELIVKCNQEGGKILNSRIYFDCTTTNKALTPSGLWKEFLKPGDPMDYAKSNYYKEHYSNSTTAIYGWHLGNSIVDSAGSHRYFKAFVSLSIWTETSQQKGQEFYGWLEINHRNNSGTEVYQARLQSMNNYADSTHRGWCIVAVRGSHSSGKQLEWYVRLNPYNIDTDFKYGAISIFPFISNNFTFDSSLTHATSDIGTGVEWWSMRRGPYIASDQSNVGSTSVPVYVDANGKMNTCSVNDMIASLPPWSAAPNDNTQFIRRDNNGSAEFGQVPFSSIYQGIKNKVFADRLFSAAQLGRGSGNHNGALSPLIISVSIPSGWSTVPTGMAVNANLIVFVDSTGMSSSKNITFSLESWANHPENKLGTISAHVLGVNPGFQGYITIPFSGATTSGMPAGSTIKFNADPTGQTGVRFWTYSYDVQIIY